jgi:hypothetical protein
MSVGFPMGSLLRKWSDILFRFSSSDEYYIPV